MRRLFFAAGDVGGARALSPVARQAATQGIAVLALRHGPLADEGDPAWTWLSEAAFGAADIGPGDVTLFASSVADWAALRAAVSAQRRGARTLHLLDNWSTYAQRLRGPEGLEIRPDAYAVMDDLALREAAADGVPADSLVVTGHPGLAKLATEAVALRAAPNASDPRAELLFVSEPAAADAPRTGERGYDETGVAADALGALAGLGLDRFRLAVAPHPREDRSAVAARFTEQAQRIADGGGAALAWRLVPPDGVRAALHGADGVIGMSSLLLYEAWLLEIPVASVQPGLRLDALRSFSRRDGLLFCESPDAIAPALDTLLAAAERRRAARMKNQKAPLSPRLQIHVDASEAVLRLAASLAQANM